MKYNDSTTTINSFSPLVIADFPPFTVDFGLFFANRRGFSATCRFAKHVRAPARGFAGAVLRLNGVNPEFLGESQASAI